MFDTLTETIQKMPLIAILRGIRPDEAAAVSDALIENGLFFMEVTLNSPDWQQSLQIIKKRHGDTIILGAGTVLSANDVDKVHAVGGQVIISPNMNVEVIARSKQLGLISAPGCYSPTECFTALEAGADILKIFPADTLGPAFLKAIAAVLPANTPICPTGGVNVDTMGTFLECGVYAMGIGSALYKEGKSAAEVGAATAEFTTKYHELVR
ncbi:MAG: 2-dehydro-3-deoxy-6-phosphogalactonate aldolase [Sneathiella sp.]